MTKAELVAQVADKTQMTQQQTAQVVDLLLASIVEALQAGDKVELRGFGSFRRRARRPRQGRNPKTGETVKVPAQIVPFFHRWQADSHPTQSTADTDVRFDTRVRHSDDNQGANRLSCDDARRATIYDASESPAHDMRRPMESAGKCSAREKE